MTRGRVEAFSDGVIAIIITIMVLEMKVPHSADAAALRPVLPVLLSYVMSFIYLGIYWNNHHHLFQAVRRVSGGILWANLHLLFWLSLIPFVTGWMGENHFAKVPVALYGVVLLCAAIAYFILTLALLRVHGRESALGMALGAEFKEIISMGIYVAAIPLALVAPLLATALYAAVAIVWIVPDRRIERALTQGARQQAGGAQSE
ncbi:MAG: TMEM175 family protein [Tepidisphaeraceae bacterium]